MVEVSKRTTFIWIVLAMLRDFCSRVYSFYILRIFRLNQLASSVSIIYRTYREGIMGIVTVSSKLCGLPSYPLDCVDCHRIPDRRNPLFPPWLQLFGFRSSLFIWHGKCCKTTLSSFCVMLSYIMCNPFLLKTIIRRRKLCESLWFVHKI